MTSVIFKSVILGAPASGKGTISSRILKNFNLEHISSGDKLRQNIQQKTAIGFEAQKYIQSGNLVPDDIMIKFVSGEIAKVSNESWLLDGFPRTLSQAEALWEVEKLDLAINLEVPFQIIIDRIKGRWIHLPSGRVYNEGFNSPKVPEKDDITGEPLIQRDDDKPNVVLKRLEQYEKLTRPVIEFYRSNKILRDFKVNFLQKKWKSARDYYIREKKKENEERSGTAQNMTPFQESLLKNLNKNDDDPDRHFLLYFLPEMSKMTERKYARLASTLEEFCLNNV